MMQTSIICILIYCRFKLCVDQISQKSSFKLIRKIVEHSMKQSNAFFQWQNFTFKMPLSIRLFLTWMKNLWKKLAASVSLYLTIPPGALNFKGRSSLSQFRQSSNNWLVHSLNAKKFSYKCISKFPMHLFHLATCGLTLNLRLGIIIKKIMIFLVIQQKWYICTNKKHPSDMPFISSSLEQLLLRLATPFRVNTSEMLVQPSVPVPCWILF